MLTDILDPAMVADHIAVVAQSRDSGSGGSANHIISNLFNILLSAAGLGAIFQAAKANFGMGGGKGGNDRKEALNWLLVGIAILAVSELIIPLTGTAKGIISSIFT